MFENLRSKFGAGGCESELFPVIISGVCCSA